MTCEVLREDGLYGTPLIETEVVDDNEEKLLSLVQSREDHGLEQFRTHQRTPIALLKVEYLLNPVFVFATDELGKGRVGILLLHQ